MSNLIFSLILISLPALSFSSDPRLKKNDVKKCFETTKRYLSSSEYYGKENEEKIIGACRGVDPDCVAAVGDSYRPISIQSSRAGEVLSLVRGCRGKNMGKCFNALIAGVPSFDRREASQILALLAKCE